MCQVTYQTNNVAEQNSVAQGNRGDRGDWEDWGSREPRGSAVDELIALGWQINANQYRIVHLAARYDTELEWFHQGLPHAAAGIAYRLDMHTSTAREWIRVGHLLNGLPLIDAAFAANELSYAKVRILTRWADPDNEHRLLALAETCTAGRLTKAIDRELAGDEDDDQRDRRLHEARQYTSYTDPDGMTVIRIVLPPGNAKPIDAAVEAMVKRIAKLPKPTLDPPADGSQPPTVTDPEKPATLSGHNPSAGGSTLPTTLEEIRERWQPTEQDPHWIPSLPQQRADAFLALFLQLGATITTEVVLHVRGDGNTLDDGTPITNHAIARQLDHSFIRLLLHDAEQRPVNASSKRRHPTTRQHRVAMETHNHQCVDCQSTDLLELDHNPPYEQTRHTTTDELEPRCAPCHRARHRWEEQQRLAA